MATAISSRSSHIGSALVWLDDISEEDLDSKTALQALFDNVLSFTNPQACLDLVETIDPTRTQLSLLISGRFGATLVREYFQNFPQIKYIYVFCMDIDKHSRWAKTCDKVRCVVSDISKILQYMQYDLQGGPEPKDVGPPLVDETPMEQPTTSPPTANTCRERFTDDNNLFNQLALALILDDSNDGIEDFNKFCQASTKEHSNVPTDSPISPTYFDPNSPIHEWFRPDRVYVQLNSNNLADIWSLRWFIRIFYRQLMDRYRVLAAKNETFTMYHATLLSDHELKGLKHRIGHSIILTESLLATLHVKTAFDLWRSDDDQASEKYPHRVVFEIRGNTTTKETVPYGPLHDDYAVLFFGARVRLIKMQFVDENVGYWLIGFKLCPTLDLSVASQSLFNYYYQELTALKNHHQAFGRLWMYKGCYQQAEEWLKIDQCHEELAELAIRQSQFLQAEKYLEDVPKDSEYGNLLRAYLHIMASKEDRAKGRRLLIQICSESADRLLRVRANLALGFLHLIYGQHVDQAMDYFTVSHEIVSKMLPPIHPIIARVLIGIGYCAYVRHDLETAKQQFEKAFEIQKEALTYHHPEFARTRNALARCLASDEQRRKQALVEFDYALNILLERYGQTNPKHLEILATNGDIEYLRKGKELRARNILLDYI